MIYNSVSIKEVLGRIVLATSAQQGEFLARCPEWIAQAMGMMKTRVTLVRRWEPLQMEFHKAALPCGVQSVQAVEYCGTRVPYYNGDRAFDAPATGLANTGVGPTVFGTRLTTNGALAGGLATETELYLLNQLPDGPGYYYTELGYLNTSFPSGTVVLHYRAIPLDEEGYPLIPDNENYKQALYWYCRSMMIGAGYKDTVFTYPACEERFEKHAQRAMSQITYPSVDQVASWVENQNRLIFPENWANNFHSPLGEERIS